MNPSFSTVTGQIILISVSLSKMDSGTGGQSTNVYRPSKTAEKLRMYVLLNNLINLQYHDFVYKISLWSFRHLLALWSNKVVFL